MKLNLEKIQRLIDEKYIKVQTHPTEDLYIYNYTPNTQFKQNWNEHTMMCRGLITDKEGRVLARPFKKFFNLGEPAATVIQLGTYEVQEKMDGSLGILYWVDDVPFLATRGSFTSDQATKGSEMLRKNVEGIKWFDRNLTYLFEIIYPENKIVVDYGRKERLVLIGAIDTETGVDVEIPDDCPFERPEVFTVDLLKNPNLVLELELDQKENAEGYVLFRHGHRVKIKFEEYKRLHRLLTECTARSIWDLMRTGSPIAPLLEKVPDEFYEWVRTWTKKLGEQFDEISKLCKGVVKKAEVDIKIENNFPDLIDSKVLRTIRSTFNKDLNDFFIKEAGEHLDVCEILFNKIGKYWKRDAADLIWKKLRPNHEVPFKTKI